MFAFIHTQIWDACTDFKVQYIQYQSSAKAGAKHVSRKPKWIPKKVERGKRKERLLWTWLCTRKKGKQALQCFIFTDDSATERNNTLRRSLLSCSSVNGPTSMPCVRSSDRRVLPAAVLLGSCHLGTIAANAAALPLGMGAAGRRGFPGCGGFPSWLPVEPMELAPDGMPPFLLLQSTWILRTVQSHQWEHSVSAHITLKKSWQLSKYLKQPNPTKPHNSGTANSFCHPNTTGGDSQLITCQINLHLLEPLNFLS